MNHYLMISRLIKIVNKFYWHLLASPENEARHLGVNIGKNCLISTRYWSSEPYLITIGDNVQVTDNVSFHTHGGGHCIRSKCPSFDAFGKIVIKEYFRFYKFIEEEKSSDILDEYIYTCKDGTFNFKVDYNDYTVEEIKKYNYINHCFNFDKDEPNKIPDKETCFNSILATTGKDSGISC